jgi:uncharacterized membrane protein YfcA
MPAKAGLMLMIEITSAFLGVIIGSVLALTGAGGAMLAVPILVIFLHISVFQAAPIALLAVFMASSIGAIQGLRKGTVRYKTAMMIACVGILLAPLGVKLAQHASNQLLSLILCSILIWISIQSWKSSKNNTADNSTSPPPACAINPATSKVFWTASCTKRLIGTGAITGFLSGMLGVGGGFVIVPSLNKVSNFNHQTIIATTLAAISLISISSITSHLQTSHINWHIAIPFAASAMLTMIITTEVIGNKIDQRTSQKAFAILCVLAAVHLAIKNVI